LALLTRREHSASELLRKLIERGYAREIAQQVVATLQSGGWQDDARYAEQLTRTRLRKGYGPVYIRHRLQRQGVDAPPVAEILSEEGQDWDSLIASVYRKKYGLTAPRDATDNPAGKPGCTAKPPEGWRTGMDAHEWAKRARFLQGRGFTVEQIRRFLDRLKQGEPSG
jgi:regulatory protein